MGYGSYQATDWQKLKQSRGINASSEVKDMFAKSAKDKYLPKYFDKRESFDSVDSPDSTPIIIAFDDTASMGYLAKEIATNALNKTILEIYDKKPVTNPHVCCAAFGNNTDNAPLQVTQFEADVRVAEQLFDMYIEQGGNGYSGDPYVWYFAAKHTKIDSYEKRNKKGFLFTIGDDFCKNSVIKGMEKWELKEIFGDDVKEDLITPEQAYEMACEKYNVFHIIVKPLCLPKRAMENWETIAPGHTAIIYMQEHVSYIPEIIISIMQLVNGANKEDVLAQWEGDLNTRIWVGRAIQRIEV